MESFLRVVWANPNIKGVTVGTMEHKFSAHADDILFHLTDPLVSLPNLMKELQLFGMVSNFKISYTKSEILPITLPSTLTANLKETFPFTWANSSLKYLGIRLTDQTGTLYTQNFAPLLGSIRRDFQTWDKTAFTWTGRTNIIKMNILPRILFFLQMVPVSLPNGFFTHLTSMFAAFVWWGRKPRKAMRVFKSYKRMGGLGVPDIKQYYGGVVLQRILNWCHHNATKLFVPLEKFMAGRNLSYASWLPWEYRGLSDAVSPLTTHALRV